MGNLFRGVVAGVLAIVAVSQCDSLLTRQGQESSRQRDVEANRQVAESRKKACLSDRAVKLGEFQKLFDEKKFQEAAAALESCADHLEDADLKAKVSHAKGLGHLAIVNDPTQDLGNRLSSLTSLEMFFPEQAKEATATGRKIRAEKARLDAVEVRATAARKRREGVSIGMSKEDVLASSWGRPQKVNKTVYSFGVHEQWVYSGGYLYFENDRLTTIQH